MEETIYDQPINNEVRKYQQDKTIIIQQGDCQIMHMLKENYRLIVVDLSK